jgi:predicted phage tail protein
MDRDEEGRSAAEGDPVRSAPRSWGGRSGGLAGIAFVLLIIASWFVDTTSFEDADQTAQVIGYVWFARTPASADATAER